MMKNLCFLVAALLLSVASNAQIYNEHDKSVLRDFLRQPSDVTGKLNLERVGLTISDTLSWLTNESWIEKIQGVTWNNNTPKCVTLIQWRIRALAGNLNVSQCTQLKKMGLYFNQISQIDASECRSLEELDCEDNAIKAIFIQNCDSLINLFCSNNLLEEINVANTIHLEALQCSNNQLSNLDVTGCHQLKWLDCFNNQLLDLQIGENDNLRTVYCYYNQLQSLDISKCNNLMGLHCSNNQLSELDLAHCSYLYEFACGNNQLNQLVINPISTMHIFFCGNNQLETLDVGHVDFFHFGCRNNRLTGIDLRSAKSLEDLDVSNNELKKLDLSKNPELINIYCDNNQLTNINVQNMPRLNRLNISGNQLEKLDVSKNPELDVIGCDNNLLKFSTLPVEQFYSYTYAPQNLIDGGQQPYSAVDLQSEYNINGHITAFKWYNITDGNVPVIDFSNNEGLFVFSENLIGKNLRCEMQNAVFPHFTEETPLAFEVELKSVAIPQIDNDDFINIYPNPATNQLKIENGELRIENVEILDIVGRKLSTFNSQLSTVDVSHLPLGMYFVRIKTEKGMVTKKVVKQ